MSENPRTAGEPSQTSEETQELRKAARAPQSSQRIGSGERIALAIEVLVLLGLTLVAFVAVFLVALGCYVLTRHAT